MKKLLIISLAAMGLLSACSTYQMNTVRSTNTPLDEKAGGFKFENDTLKITYAFAGQDIPIHVTIYNKLDEPVYVDWKRSALISDNQSYSYADNAVQINGDVSGVSIGRGVAYSAGSVNAQAILPQNVIFVPPHTQITKSISKFNREKLKYVAGDSFVKTKVPGYGLGDENVKIAKFDKDNSPYLFKSYITIYTLDGNTPKPKAYQNDFYVSEIMRSSLAPENFEAFSSSRGDYFVTSASN
jgi:hypothetical protein